MSYKASHTESLAVESNLRHGTAVSPSADEDPTCCVEKLHESCRFVSTRLGENGMIHPTASVHPLARIGRDVTIGAHAAIGKETTIGDETWIGPHATIGDGVAIGARNTIATGACVGVSDRDKSPTSGAPLVLIGDRNFIREFVCVAAGPESDHPTCIGNDNFLMACCHLGPGCRVGNNIVLANGTTIGARVVLGDSVNISGLVRVEDGVRIGRLAMVGGVSHVEHNVSPFTMVTGNPATPRCLNYTGLKRNGLTAKHLGKDLRALKKIWWSCHRSAATRLEPFDLAVSATSALAAEFLAFNRDNGAPIASDPECR